MAEGARFLFVAVVVDGERLLCRIFHRTGIQYKIGLISQSYFPLGIFSTLNIAIAAYLVCYKFGVIVEKNTSVAASLSMALYSGIWHLPVSITNKYIYI